MLNMFSHNNSEIHMTGAMTNPMNGILRLWKEKLLLRLIDKNFFLVQRALTHLYFIPKGRKENVKDWIGLGIPSTVIVQVILTIMRKTCL